MNDLKAALYQHCFTYLQSRIDSISYTIQDAQEAANGETKSSAGDKYETGRAMAQQETDRNTGLLNEANKQMATLNRIPASGTSAVAGLGSIVITGNGLFYLAVSAGSVVINNETYFVVSSASPIGVKLTGSKAGDRFVLNGKQYDIKQVL
ncbi:3-oxoacyl-ACP synthase [Mucilaginibacter sp. HMF5004]|uniref:3-oxoacyl-ACP synthase n=1 Tax=Mucilaginibacter rivuli TaxID=2857527 RepID=UPI001C5D5240|nr:3-oxoacyl-ACP synthase [Mucilaginibacter rivuli]MBW4891060.1 3-oxoacyl-ACP synthase [Mucilaginibacter rivuli]